MKRRFKIKQTEIRNNVDTLIIKNITPEDEHYKLVSELQEEVSELCINILTKIKLCINNLRSIKVFVPRDHDDSSVIIHSADRKYCLNSVSAKNRTQMFLMVSLRCGQHLSVSLIP